MTHEQKLQVKEALVRYTASFETIELTAASLESITPTIISQVQNDNWQMLSDRTWYQLARQVGFYCGDWVAADTSVSLLLRILFGDAQHYAMAYGIAVSPGLGKTFSAGQYIREQENVFYLACNAEHNQRSFMSALLQAAGIMPSGSLPYMIQKFTNTISAENEPLLIIDDAHTLKDRVLHLLVRLANGLTGLSGIVMMGADNLRQRITEGVQAKKTGFDKIYNTFGQRFVTLSRLSPKDIEVVCRANGVEDMYTIASIAMGCNGSLHKIASLINQYRQMKIAA